MEEIVECARRLARHGVYLFFKHQSHFLNPLVPADSARLAESRAILDKEVRRVVLELLPERLPNLAKGIYSPVPIAHALAEGVSLAEALDRFRYEMIRVDDDQKWWWQDRPVAPRIQKFFTENLAYESALDLYFFEYKVNPEWWDKCYMECAITPILVRSIEEPANDVSSVGLRATLNNGRRDDLDLQTLRLDARERLLCRSANYGDVLFSDNLRFSLLKGVAEDLASVEIGGVEFPLAWDEGASPI